METGGAAFPEASYLTLDMLKDAVRPDAVNMPRLVSEARPVAWKTGTSFSYRDAWSAGVFDNYVLVVWVGNFDGTENPEFVGRTAAAPFSFAWSTRCGRVNPAPAETCFTRTPDLNLRQVDLCAVSGMIAGPNCPQTMKGWFIPGKSPIGACDVHRRIWVDNATGLRLSGEPESPVHRSCRGLRVLAVRFGEAFSGGGFAARGATGISGRKEMDHGRCE